MTHYYHATRNTQHYGASLTWRARGRQPQPRLPSPPALYRTDSKPPLVRSGRSQLRRLQSESHAINDQATRVEKPSAYPESRRKGTRWEGEGGGGGDPRASCVQRIPRCTNSRTMPPSICTRRELADGGYIYRPSEVDPHMWRALHAKTRRLAGSLRDAWCTCRKSNSCNYCSTTVPPGVLLVVTAISTANS